MPNKHGVNYRKSTAEHHPGSNPGGILPDHMPPGLTITVSMSIKLTQEDKGTPALVLSSTPSKDFKGVDMLNCCLGLRPKQQSEYEGGGRLLSHSPW